MNSSSSSSMTLKRPFDAVCGEVGDHAVDGDDEVDDEDDEDSRPPQPKRSSTTMAAKVETAAAPTTSVCGICVEVVTTLSGVARGVLSRKPYMVSCYYCRQAACSECWIKYWETNISQPFHCMDTSCRKLFSREWICKQFSPKHINGSLKEIKERRAFEQQISKLESTMPIVKLLVLQKKYADMAEKLRIHRNNVVDQERDIQHRLREISGRLRESETTGVDAGR